MFAAERTVLMRRSRDSMCSVVAVTVQSMACYLLESDTAAFELAV